MLLRVLTSRPGDATATSLIRQIDTAPETLLGEESFPYKTRPDDTLSLLAERFLGDPTLFYALARYNHIQVAGTLEPGLTLRIPGRAKPSPRPTHHAGDTDNAAKPVPAAPPAPPPPAANPKRAVQLRAAGLEQLNRGSIDRAVALLQEAARLDPANSLIQKDLDRALKISRAVHAK